MPRYADETIFQMGINPALLDRRTFIDALGNEKTNGLETELTRVRDEMCRINALRGKTLASLTAAEQHAAMLTLLYAEQWELGYAESNPGQPYERQARQSARRYRALRFRRFGPTALEAALDAEASSLNIFKWMHESQS